MGTANLHSGIRAELLSDLDKASDSLRWCKLMRKGTEHGQSKSVAENCVLVSCASGPTTEPSLG